MATLNNVTENATENQETTPMVQPEQLGTANEPEQNGWQKDPDDESEIYKQWNPQQSQQEQEKVKMCGSIPADSMLKFEPSPFNAFGKIMRTTNRKLCEVIKSHFQTIFHELRGVMIFHNNGSFITEFYFEKNANPLPQGKILSIEDLTKAPIKQNTKERRSFYDGQTRIYNKAEGKIYALNKETKLLLSDLMYGGRQANKPEDNKRWDQSVECRDLIVNNYPYYTGFQSGAHEYIIKVGNIDIHRVLRAIYGNSMVTSTRKRDEDNKMINTTSSAMYECRYINLKPGSSDEFIMHVEQFDKDAVTRFTAEETIMPFIAPSGIRFW